MSDKENDKDNNMTPEDEAEDKIGEKEISEIESESQANDQADESGQQDAGMLNGHGINYWQLTFHFPPFFSRAKKCEYRERSG